MLWNSIRVTKHFVEEVLPDREYLVDIPHRIREAVSNPIEQLEQMDGQTRRWVFVPETGHYLSVVVAADGETVVTAFRDRGYARSHRG